MRLVANVRKALLAFIALITFGGMSGALTPPDVERVVTVLAALKLDMGDLAYDEEAAEVWLEEDEAGEGRIAAAGFDADEWREALDRTMKGFFAALPAQEVQAMLDTMQGFEGRSDFSRAQIEAMRALVAEARDRLMRWRREGAADADVVRPHVPRIRALLEARR
jgi:hypothetical protein